MIGVLRKSWHRLVRPALRRMGFDIRRYPMRPWQEEAHDALLQLRHIGQLTDQPEITSLILFFAAHVRESYSQLLQDLFVRHHLGDRRGGFFVEFGATDGVSWSNTKHLEEALGWRGILAEPAHGWHERLRKNRSCAIDTRCVWSASGEVLRFRETSAADLSTIESFSESDRHAEARRGGKSYDVETISLADLLAAHDAPRQIDYVSVDTEGSELAILSAFDFSKYEIAILTVEHNYGADREKIHALLRSHGYTRVFVELSRWDDWYVKSGLPIST